MVGRARIPRSQVFTGVQLVRVVPASMSSKEIIRDIVSINSEVENYKN